MIRLAVVFCLLASSAVAQVIPLPRPEGLVERNRAAATAVEEAAAAEAEVVSAAVAEVAQTPTPQSSDIDRAEIAAQITGAIRNCWNVGDMSDAAMAVRIWVAFNTTPQGDLIRESIEMTEFSNGTQDAADEALGPAFRAIMRCAEAGLNFPPETHDIWQRVEIQFDASSMVTR